VNCDSSTRLTVYIEVAQPPRPPPPPPPSPAVPPLPMSPPTPPPTKWRTAAMKNTIVSLLILCYRTASEAAASYFNFSLASCWRLLGSRGIALSWLGFDGHSGPFTRLGIQNPCLVLGYFLSLVESLMALTLADEGRRSSLLLAFTGCAFVNGLLSSSAAGCAGGAATMIASLIFNSTRAVFFFTCAADAATAAAIFTLLLLSQLTFIVIGTTTGLQHDLARLKTGHFVDNHGESFSLCFGLAVMQFSWLLMGVRAEPFFEMVIALLVWMIGLPMAFPGIVAKHRQRGLDQTVFALIAASTIFFFFTNLS